MADKFAAMAEKNRCGGKYVQWFLKFPAIFCNAIFVKMAGNLSYFAKKKLHQKFFVQFNFELEELVLERFDNAVFSSAEIQKDKPKEKEKKFQQTAITSYFKN